MKRFLLLLMALCLLFTTACAAEAPSDSAVTALFLNVGKADSALYLLGDKAYLIDTGTAESADAMLKALAAYDVTHLDGVILTHTDKDHVGGLKALLKSSLTVDMLYAGELSVDPIDDHPVVKRSEKYGVPLTWLKAGDVLTVDEQTRFVTLGPLSLDSENENNNSLVFRLETAEGSMLLTGDMELEEEAALLQAGALSQVAVLKVGHHGEDDASSDSFIFTVRPQVAVVSTDSAVETDTPDPKVVKRLWNVGAEVFVTQKATCCVRVTLSNGVATATLIQYQE